MFWCIWKKILYYLSSQKLMCVLKKHMQTSFPGLFGGSGQVFRVLKEEGRDERELSLWRKDGGWARMESASLEFCWQKAETGTAGCKDTLMGAGTSKAFLTLPSYPVRLRKRPYAKGRFGSQENAIFSQESSVIWQLEFYRWSRWNKAVMKSWDMEQVSLWERRRRARAIVSQ